jgi:hypothetical protein
MKKIRIENTLQLAEFALSLPGTSAPVKRVFSEFKILPSTDKSIEGVSSFKFINHKMPL